MTSCQGLLEHLKVDTAAWLRFGAGCDSGETILQTICRKAKAGSAKCGRFRPSKELILTIKRPIVPASAALQPDKERAYAPGHERITYISDFKKPQKTILSVHALAMLPSPSPSALQEHTRRQSLSDAISDWFSCLRKVCGRALLRFSGLDCRLNTLLTAGISVCSHCGLISF